ncbi:MAG: hypothetical protein QGH20_06955, partial [Candidatus Latescibacteria bacterium]|nr:hypothetical protein [Candidatus Latescibacterota bacterium]
ITPYSEYRLHSVELFQGELPLGALAALIVVLLPLQWLFGRLAPKWRFSEGELLFMFVMGFAGIMVYHIGMMGLFLSIISSPDYFASPENRYELYLLPHLPRWAIVSNWGREMTWFYTGLPPGRSIPWGVWVGPLFWWWSFFLAFLLLCSAITSVLRRQWFDNEKIRFPQAEIPLALVEGAEGKSGLPTVMRSSRFWLGFTLAGGVLVWNIGSYFSNIWPRIDVSQYLPITMNMGLNIGVSQIIPDPFVIGISYLVDTNVLASVWFFYLLMKAQLAVQATIGYTSGQTDLWTTSDNLSGWQTLGGLFAIVLWGLWMSRTHLAAVWRKAWNQPGGVDDSNELVSHRASVISIPVCSLYMIGWLIQLGLSPGVAVVLLVSLIILVIGATRIVAESGMLIVGTPVTAQGITLRTFGDQALGPENIVGLAVTLAAFRMVEGYPMAMTMHAARLGDAASVKRRPLLMAILIGSAVAMVVMALTTIWLAYNGGAFNFGAHHAFKQMYEAYDHMTSRIRNPLPFDWRLFAHFGGGAAFVMSLITLRLRFGWSLLNPIGYCTATTFYHNSIWSGVFIAWAIKVIVNRMGGLNLYLKWRPMFIGLVAGHVVGAVLCLAVDWIWFPGEGHDIRTMIYF